MCNGPDHMFKDRDLGAKYHNRKLAKSRIKFLAMSLYGEI